MPCDMSRPSASSEQGAMPCDMSRCSAASEQGTSRAHCLDVPDGVDVALSVVAHSTPFPCSSSDSRKLFCYFTNERHSIQVAINCISQFDISLIKINCLHKINP